MRFTLKVTVLLGLGHSRVEAAWTLGAGTKEVRAAVGRLQRISPEIDRYADDDAPRL